MPVHRYRCCKRAVVQGIHTSITRHCITHRTSGEEFEGVVIVSTEERTRYRHSNVEDIVSGIPVGRGHCTAVEVEDVVSGIPVGRGYYCSIEVKGITIIAAIDRGHCTAVEIENIFTDTTVYGSY